jgi:hypothetical protein
LSGPVLWGNLPWIALVGVCQAHPSIRLKYGEWSNRLPVQLTCYRIWGTAFSFALGALEILRKELFPLSRQKKRGKQFFNFSQFLHTKTTLAWKAVGLGNKKGKKYFSPF